jgi:hypothetical protein
MIVKRAMVLAGLAALTLDVSGQSVPTQRTLTWVPGLEYASGGTFDESAIQHYNLYCDGQYVGEVVNDFTRTYVATVGLLGPGDHTCGLSETVDGIESVMSNTVTFPLGKPTPKAPVLTLQ